MEKTSKIWIRTAPVDGEADKHLVEQVHFKPFHPTYGLPEATLAEGVLVDSLPARNPKAGYYEQMFFNPSTGALWYEYIEDPNTPTAEMKSRLQAAEDALLAILLSGGAV